jgi:hypothetical protein
MKIKQEEEGPISIEVLDRHWKEPRKCQICQTELELSDTIYELAEFMPSYPAVASARIPVVALLCKECGNIMLFDAIALKILDVDGRWLGGKQSHAGGEENEDNRSIQD